MTELVFRFPVCNCHGGPEHQRIEAHADGHCILSCCKWSLWLMERTYNRQCRDGPLTYSFPIHLEMPPQEWLDALGEMNE